MRFRQWRTAVVLIALGAGVGSIEAQKNGARAARELDEASVIRMVDSTVAARVENVLGFTGIEHYAVYRGDDEKHPATEMTVRETYKKGVGKTFEILAESGSDMILRFGLHPLLDNDKTLNQPGNVEHSWFTSANYAMKLKPGGVQKINGHDCYALEIAPRQKAPHMIEGTLWVDAQNGSVTRVAGVASKSPSPLAGTTKMMRDYAQINGFSMATHARAESNSLFVGRTVVTIDYRDYHLQIR